MFITQPDVYRPEIILWLELPNDLIVKFELLDPRQPVSFSRTLSEAMRAPMAGTPRRPRRIRVADAALAAELRSAVRARIPIVVAPTPDLEAVLEAVGELPPPGAEPRSYLENGRVSEETVELLFRSARTLSEIAPWKSAADSQLLRIDVPESGLRGHCLSIIGALGESFGFLLFPSLAVWNRFGELGAAGESGGDPIDVGAGWFSLTFERGANLAPEMKREVVKHGWPVAGPNAYPVVERRERDGMPRPLTDGDVRLVAACAGALGAFFVRHGEIFEADTFVPVSESYSGASGLVVRTTVPYEAFDEFEEEAPGEEPPDRFSNVGRNDPCPCGSGKKYKKCHLGKNAAGQTAAPRSPESPFELGGRLTERILGSSPARLKQDMAKFAERHDLTGDLPPFVVPLLTYGVPLAGSTIAERYRHRKKSVLSARERAWLDAEARAWLSIWEVTAIEPGAGMTLKDLLCGEVCDVKEATASKTLSIRSAVLARVIEFEGTALLSTLYPRSLPPFEAAEVVRRVRGRLRLRRRVPIDRLRELKISTYMIKKWKEAVEDLDQRQQTPPMLTNTDGDELLMTTDHFDLTDGARAEVVKRLLALEGAERCGDDQGVTVVSLHRSKDAAPRELNNILIGLARIGSRRLAVETNSVRRADDLRRRVEAACGGLLRHRLREHSDPRSIANLTAPASGPEPLEGPEIDRFIVEHKKRHYADWPDVPLPALSDLTPREAVKTREGRERVDTLLKEIENGETRLPEGQLFDVSILRTELGVAG